MNGLKLKFAHLIPEKDNNLVNEGIFICLNCGGIYTTVLKKAVYCRECRIFRQFKNREKKIHMKSDLYDDDD